MELFTHFSSFVFLCTYAVLDTSRRPNGNTSSLSTHKIHPLHKEKHPNEQKLKLDHQNQNHLNVDLVALCEEGNLDQVLELMGQGAFADYGIYLALLHFVKNARQVFDQMLDRNIASWHLMIGGYTSNGLGCDGLLVFPQMKQARVLSDGETFELVLTACAQAGGGGLIGVEGGVVVGEMAIIDKVGEVIDEVAVTRVILLK
ncbi:hypothetical protein JHK82_045620 [Glycine max]|nr:hypothetical protein JHK82_045620 [Glycine max]